MVKTFIKLDRNMVHWRWFKDGNTLKLWIYILITANYTQYDFMGTTIQRGELATSHQSLADATGLTVSQVRTSLDHLKKTGEITIRRYPKFLVISAVNYDRYQSMSQSNRNQIADKSQSNHNQIAIKSQQYKNERMEECKNGIMEESVCEKHAHGKLNNVYITDSEYEKFKSEYPFTAEDIIDELSVKIATGDSRYSKGHIGHLYVFAKNYTAPKREEEHKPSFDIDLAMKRSLMIDPNKTKRTEH